jgi:hypothetical protein
MRKEIREAIKTARLVRKSIHKMLKDRGTFVREDMGGECGRAAFLLSRALPGAEVVLGVWLTEGSHCWVVYKGFIIDPTATQFGVKPLVYVLKVDGRRAKELYKAEKHGKPAERDLTDWYGGNWKRADLKYYRSFLAEREVKETGALEE